MLLLSHFSRVRLCATPQTAAHQARPSLGFSRQEHWSGLPFPSPMHESEKWKWSRSVVSDSATPWTAAHQAPPSMGFSRQEYWSGVPLASLKACPEKFYWVKRKAAVHGTREWQKLEAKSCGYDQGIKIQKDLCSVDKWGWCRGVIKTNSEMTHPRIQLVSRREILCLMSRDWGYTRYVLCSCFQPCLQIYFTLWTSLSSTHTSCSLLHRTFVHDGLIFTKLAHAHLLTNLNATISSSAKPSFIP